MSKLKILVCPLNWGLGHATRCMPIVAALQAEGAEIFWASDGRALALLQNEYPQMPIFELPSYNIHYKSSFGFIINMLQQAPSIFKAIDKEHQAIQKIVAKNDIDIIISDNRFGCFSKNTYNIFITHQINIALPWQWQAIKPLANALNFHFIYKFNECWIPDVATTPNLTGSLSHSPKIQKTPFFKYIGPVSRLKPLQTPIEYQVLALISGPEPQRTTFEEIITLQAKQLNLKTLLVRGVTEGSKQIKNLNNHLHIVDFLDSQGIEKAMCSAEIIVCRSGYTTVMDLFKMNKKAIFVATPGQTEQELLANNFKKQGLFYAQEQKNFNLEKALLLSQEYSGPQGITIPPDTLQTTIQQLLSNFPTKPSKVPW